MNKKTLLLAILAAGSTLLSACSSSAGSSSNGGNSNNGDANSLQILTPKTIYSTSAVNSGYIIIFNNTASPVSNLHYVLSSEVGSGANVSIDSASATNCATLSPHTLCSLKINIPVGSIAGSFSIKASNTRNQSTKLIQATNTVPTSLPVGIEQAAYNSISGADGITLSYYHTIINGVPYVLVSGVVASNKAGSFNNIVLVDSKNTTIPNQIQMNDNISNVQGASFMILLPVPNTNGASQTIKVQTQQIAIDGTITPVSTAKASSTLTTTSGVGIANMLPSAVYLTENNPEQVITFSNSGDALATLQSLVATNPNMEVIFSPSSLASGAYTTATLKLKNPKANGTSGAVTLNYNNGQTNTSAVTEQNVNPQPSQGATPTPEPTPTAGLTTSLVPDNDFFTTTAVGAVRRTMTIHNSGNTTENNFVFTLPNDFAITASSGGTNDCAVDAINKKVTTNLTSGSECDLTVTYTKSSLVNENSGTISIFYDYNTSNAPTPAPSPANQIVNYKVTTSTANLNITPATTDFATIIANSKTTTSAANNKNYNYTRESVTIENSGDLATTNMNFSFSQNGNALTGIFDYYAASECSNLGGILPAGTSCQLDIKFGPTGTTQVVTGANLDVDYAYSGSTGSPTAHSILNGTVLAAGSSNPTLSKTPTPSGFAGGNGTLLSPYQAEQNKTPLPSFSYTITNNSPTPATEFYIESGPNGLIVTGTCGTWQEPITLHPNDYCTLNLIYSKIDSTNLGKFNIIGRSVPARYDQSPGGAPKKIALTIAAVTVNVYLAATVKFTPESVTLPPGGESEITFTLADGYDEAGAVIIANDPAHLLTGGTCNLTTTDTLSRECKVKVKVGAAEIPSATTYSLAVSVGGSLPAPTTTNINLTVLPRTVSKGD